MPPSSATRCSCPTAARRAPTSPAATRACCTARSGACCRCRPQTRLFMCHDYGPNGREIRWETTVAEERAAQHPCPRRHQRGRVRRDAHGARRDARHAAPDHPLDPGEHARRPAPAARSRTASASSRCRSTRSDAGTAPRPGQRTPMARAQAVDRPSSVAPQITRRRMSRRSPRPASASIICNRPDGEGADQPGFAEIEARGAAGRAARPPICPSSPARCTDERCGAVRRAARPAAEAGAGLLPHRHALGHAVGAVGGGARPAAAGDPRRREGGRLRHGRRRAAHRQWRTHADRRRPMRRHEVVIIGGGAAGIAVASSLQARKPDLDIAIIDPGRHPLLPAGLDHGRRRRLRRRRRRRRTMASLIPHGRALDQGGGRRLRAGEQRGHPRWLPRRQLHRARRRAGPQAELGRHRGAGRDARPQRRHLQLPLRPGALYLGAGAGAEGAARARVHPAADADQMRRRAAEGDVSRRPITGAATGVLERHRHRFLQCRRRCCSA